MSSAGSEDLLASILGAPDRDTLGATNPIVSVRADDERSFREAVERRSQLRLELFRRGVRHGTWVELGTASGAARGAAPRARWHAARPALLHGIANEILLGRADALRQARTRFTDLSTAGGLEHWLSTQRGALAPDFEIGEPLDLVDPERDLGRMAVRTRDFELWIKVARLSTHPNDASLRMRFSFGREGPDDSNPDPARQRAVHDLAARMLPEVRAVLDVEELRRLLDSSCGTHVLPTQAIAYWNAPNGGALFHHDSFDEPFDRRQLGVLFVQLSGRTAWLALSMEDLAVRVREFLDHMSEGELPWVRSQLFPEPSTGKGTHSEDPGDRPLGFVEALALAADDERLLAELFEPGCGRLGPLVDRGPEFTSYLADAGHACVLRPGDALLLPNFGRGRTAMHSVFCASRDVTYALSFGLRAADGVAQPRHEAE